MTPDERLDELEEALEENLEDFGDCKWSRDYAELTLTVPRKQVLSVMQILRQTQGLAFEQCMDVCGVDYAAYGDTEWSTTEAPNSGFGRGADRSSRPEPESKDRSATDALV